MLDSFEYMLFSQVNKATISVQFLLHHLFTPAPDTSKSLDGSKYSSCKRPSSLTHRNSTPAASQRCEIRVTNHIVNVISAKSTRGSAQVQIRKDSAAGTCLLQSLPNI